MKLLIGILILVIFSQCDFVENKNFTQIAISEVQKNMGLPIDFETEIEYDKAILRLKIDSHHLDELSKSKIILTTVIALKERDLFYDRLILKGKNRSSDYVRKGLTMKKVLLKYSLCQNVIAELKARKFGHIYSQMKKDFQKGVGMKDFIRTAQKQKYSSLSLRNLEGFTFSYLDKKRIVTFHTITPSGILKISFPLKGKSTKIEHIEM